MIFVLMLVAALVTLAVSRLLAGRTATPAATLVVLGSLLPILVTFGVPLVSVLLGGPSPRARAWNTGAMVVGLVLSVLIAGICGVRMARAVRAGLSFVWPWLAATAVAAMPAMLWAMTVALWAVAGHVHR